MDVIELYNHRSAQCTGTQVSQKDPSTLAYSDSRPWYHSRRSYKPHIENFPIKAGKWGTWKLSPLQFTLKIVWVGTYQFTTHCSPIVAILKSLYRFHGDALKSIAQFEFVCIHNSWVWKRTIRSRFIHFQEYVIKCAIEAQCLNWCFHFSTWLGVG